MQSNVYTPGGRLLATYEGPGEGSAGYHYNLTDWLGTKRMQTNASGTMAANGITGRAPAMRDK